MGCDKYFEWTIETPTSTYNAALSSSGLKTSDNFHTGILAIFRARLNSLYPKQIANVSFISRDTLTNGRYGLVFRVYFINAITDRTSRTNIVSNIQLVYYELMKTYFTSIIKSIQFPTTVNITVPTAINTVCKKAVLINTSNSTQSLSGGVQLNLSKVTSVDVISKYLNFFFSTAICICL